MNFHIHCSSCKLEAHLIGRGAVQWAYGCSSGHLSFAMIEKADLVPYDDEFETGQQLVALIEESKLVGTIG